MTNEEFLESISLDGEIWKDVVGYEGLYVVSNLGRVASLTRVIYTKNGQVRTYRAKLLKPIMRQPYLSVTLCDENGQTQVSIHRIVASAHIPNDKSLPCVDHINTDVLDNRATNLRWCSQAENLQNPISHARLKKSVAGRNILCNYKSVECLKNGIVVKIYPAIKFVADDGFCPKQVSKVVTGKRNTHKGYTWRFTSHKTSISAMSKNSKK